MKFVFKLIIITSTIFAQSTSDPLESIEKSFRSLEYDEVIRLSKISLESGAITNKKDSIEVYRMMGISNYSIGKTEESLRNFWSILRLDANYALSPTGASPKIVSFFNDIKNNFNSPDQAQEDRMQEAISALNSSYERSVTTYQGSVIRSLIFPGWGHLYLDSELKGYLLLGIGAAALASSIFFAFDAAEKENQYLNETDINLIDIRYNSFNESYKLRNYSLVAFAAIWAFAQLDMLIFNGEPHSRLPRKISLQNGRINGFQLNVYLPFN